MRRRHRQAAPFQLRRDIGRVVEVQSDRLHVAKAGSRKRYDNGERLELPSRYYRESWQLLKQVVQDIADAAVRKA